MFEDNTKPNIKVTCTPAEGYMVAEAKYEYEADVDTISGTITITNNEGSFTPSSIPESDVKVTVTFKSATLAGGAAAESAVAITNSAIVTLSGGYYAVNSDITFAHDIKLTGDVKLTIANGATMTVNGIIDGNDEAGSLTVSGDGTLTVNASDTAISAISSYTQTGAKVSITTSGKYGIGITFSPVTISGGTLQVKATGSSSSGIFARSVQISGGTLSAEGTSYGLYCGSVNITGGSVTATKGIRSSGGINLGYSSVTDNITADSFNGTVTIKEGCIFLAEGTEYSGTLTDAQKTALAEKTLKPKTCTVTAVDKVTADATSAVYGGTVTLTYAESVNAGYEVVFKVNDTAIEGNTFTITADSTITAELTLINYSIEYELDGGTNAMGNPASYTVNDSITLDIPTKTGFTFLGWVGTGITEAKESPTIPAGSTGDRQYTALWSRTGGFAPAGDTPEFTYHSLVLSGKIGVMFYMYIPSTLTAEDCYMDFTVSGDVAGQDVSYSRTYTAGDYTLYGYECPITSVQMADKITATFSYGTNTIKQEYRAKTYIDGVIADTSEAEDSRNLCKAIKNYGSYVQPILADSNNWVIGVDHAKMDSVDAYTADDFTDTATNTEDYAAKYDIPTDSGIESLSCSLVLDSDTAIKIYLTPKSTYTGEVVATWGGYSNSLTQNSAGQYVVEISDIPAHELSKTYTVTITTGSVNFDIEVSALSYVQGVIKNGESSTAMKEAVTAIYRYYRETMTYRGNN